MKKTLTQDVLSVLIPRTRFNNSKLKKVLPASVCVCMRGRQCSLITGVGLYEVKDAAVLPLFSQVHSKHNTF